MMPTAVTTKSDMYKRLAAGEFGNAIPQYFSVEEWRASGDDRRFALWGVRSARTSMHPACRLNCPAAEVAAHVATHFADGPNISMMVDAVAGIGAWLEVWDAPGGLVVEGIERPDVAGGWTWRNSMKEPSRRRRWEGVAARLVLARHLNENSRDDLAALLDRYPDHVVEVSALDRCIGNVPHRNGVVWEVRAY